MNREEVTQALTKVKTAQGYIVYEDFVALMGKVLVECIFGASEGDSYYLIHDPDKGYGYICIGWGSCSVCDALEACDTLEEIVDLYFEIYDQIHWEPDQKLMARWMLIRDWSLTEYGGCILGATVGAMLTWLGASADVYTRYRAGGLWGELVRIEDNRVIEDED